MGRSYCWVWQHYRRWMWPNYRSYWMTSTHRLKVSVYTSGHNKWPSLTDFKVIVCIGGHTQWPLLTDWRWMYSRLLYSDEYGPITGHITGHTDLHSQIEGQCVYRLYWVAFLYWLKVSTCLVSLFYRLKVYTKLSLPLVKLNDLPSLVNDLHSQIEGHSVYF